MGRWLATVGLVLLSASAARAQGYDSATMRVEPIEVLRVSRGFDCGHFSGLALVRARVLAVERGDWRSDTVLIRWPWCAGDRAAAHEYLVGKIYRLRLQRWGRPGRYPASFEIRGLPVPLDGGQLDLVRRGR